MENSYGNRHNIHTDRSRHSQYLQKRDIVSRHKYVRKNTTNTSSNNSPLEEIGAVS